MTLTDSQIASPGFWFHYYAQRLYAVLEDPTVNDADLRHWVNEFAEDLSDLVGEHFALSDADCDQATQLAQAMQAFIFHNGSDPHNSSEGLTQTHHSGWQKPSH